MPSGGLKSKTPVDFDSLENPVSDLNSDSSNPDAWIKPEMLRRVADRNFIDDDKISGFDE